MHVNILLARRPEVFAGGIARDDTTAAFYMRVNALLRPEQTVLDLGAGRGGQLDGEPTFRKSLARIRGKVACLHGCDVDEAVLENPHLDQAAVFDPAGPLPYDDSMFDLVYSDWVIEHLEEPSRFVAELERVLRPGGWFCARTPNKWGYIALGARLLPDRLEGRVLGAVQPGRQERDVFPKHYRMNTRRDLARVFTEDRWLDASFAMNATPAYHGGRSILFTAIELFQTFTPRAMNSVLLVFKQKR
jgi:SAM-dependent methyltransferase